MPHRHPAQTLATLREPDVRLRWLAEWLRQSEPIVAVGAIEEAARSAMLGQAREFYVTFVHLLLHVRPRPDLPGGPLPPPDRRLILPDVQIAALIGAAHREQLRWTAWLLRECFRPPVPLDAKMLPLHGSIEKIALGVRKERARVPNPEVVAPLLVDTTPAVIQILSENPRMTEAHMQTVATLRPTHPYALLALLLSVKWLTNVRIVEAVARSEAAPPWLVLALAPLLPTSVQKALANLPRIDMEVRDLLAEWLNLGDVLVAAAPRRVYEGTGVYDVADEDLAQAEEWQADAEWEAP